MHAAMNAVSLDQLERVTGGSDITPWGTWPSTSDPRCAGAIASAASTGTVPGIVAGAAAGLAVTAATVAKVGIRRMSAPTLRGAGALATAVLAPAVGGATTSMAAEYGLGSYAKSHAAACTGH